MEIRIPLVYDSDNTNSGDRTAKITGDHEEIYIEVDWMDRKLGFKRADLEKVVEFYFMR